MAMRFPVQALPMMFISAVLATCAGDKDEVASADEAPAATNNVGQVKVVQANIADNNVKATPSKSVN